MCGTTPYLCVIICCLLYQINGLGVRCKACQGLPTMAECTHTIQCQDNEECYTRKTIRSAGNIVYDSGCTAKQVCTALSSGVGKREASSSSEIQDVSVPSRDRRDLVACFQCCNTDYCNNNLCSTKNVSSSALECFSCNDVRHPDDCTQLTTCGYDHACQVAQTYSDQDSYCVQCCNSSYCNIKLCGSVNTAGK